jgi:hypothetical protein
MKTPSLFSLLLLCVLLSGCAKTSRSISHSGYQESGRYHGTDPAFDYRGELSEFDVLGISREQITSEEEIQRALSRVKPVKVRRESSILLIQSGAMAPDAPMVAGLSEHFTVVPFSGIPRTRPPTAGTAQTESYDPETYSKTLRLTAARGGCDLIVCYWGMLESESENLPTKTVSWVPVVNWLLPDEKQHMRIRLKVALVDIRTGDWSVFTPKSFEQARISISPRRGVVDQKQVEKLKKQAYGAAVAEMVKRHSELAAQ